MDTKYDNNNYSNVYSPRKGTLEKTKSFETIFGDKNHLHIDTFFAQWNASFVAAHECYKWTDRQPVSHTAIEWCADLGPDTVGN